MMNYEKELHRGTYIRYILMYEELAWTYKTTYDSYLCTKDWCGRMRLLVI